MSRPQFFIRIPNRFVNCTAFGTASKAFAKELTDVLATERPAAKLTEYRHLWVDLSHMMQQLGTSVLAVVDAYNFPFTLH